ncbi:MAG: VOC family protein [Bacteroidota bacterium]
MNLNQVTLPTLDLDRAILFYQTLGLELIVRAEPRYARFLCPNGQSTCSLHLVEELPMGDGIHVYFECANLDEEVDRLKKAGIVFTLDPTDQPWLWREAHLQDPDGNQLILFWAGENRINPPWRLDPPAR